MSEATNKELLKVQTKAELEALQNHEEGEVIFVEEDNQYMIYHGEQWWPVQTRMTEDGLQVNLYELNKQIIAQLPAIEDWTEATDAINTWMAGQDSKYFMLLGREINYYTIFAKQDADAEFGTFFDAIKACLDSIGPVHVIDADSPENAIEIWIEYQGEMTCIILFGFDKGVVSYNG